MKDFISLGEFLLLPANSYEKPFREFWKHKTGTQWYYWYRLAKASFEQFGIDGPPIGSSVITLVSGHGGSGKDQRIFKGPAEDKRFFLISRGDETSWVNKDTWWREIVCSNPEPTNWGKYPEGFFKRPRNTEFEAIIELIVSS